MRRLLKQLATFAALSALSVSLTGCYSTTLRSGKLATRAGIEYDERWHHGLVWGIAEISGPYNLSRVCPQGWAIIKTETSFLNGLVSVVTSGIYSPQTITVQCSAIPLAPIPMPILGVQPPAPVSAAP